MVTLGTALWATGREPLIPITFSYERFRSGASMAYKWEASVAPVTGYDYYGFPIYLEVTLDGTSREDVTLKAASPSQWSNAIVHTSGTYYVDDKTTGTVLISFRVYSGLGSNRSGTYSYSLAVDPAASELTVSDGTLGAAQTLNVKKYDSSFTHTIEYACGSASGTVCTKSSSTSLSWTPPLSLASQNTTGNSVHVTLTTTTYSGNSIVSSNQTTILCSIPPSVKPTIAPTFSDAAGFLTVFGAYIQANSALHIVANASAPYGASVVSCTIKANGQTFAATEATTDVLKNSGTIQVSITVTDTRSRTVTEDYNLTVWAYSPPVISNLNIVRCNSDGTANSSGAYAKAVFTTSIAALGNKNTTGYKLEYKKSTASSYTTVNLTAYEGRYNLSNAEYIFAADTGSSYDVRLTVSDYFASISKSTVGSSAAKLFSAFRAGLGWAFGKVAEVENLFDVAFNSRFRGTVQLDKPYFYTATGEQEWHTPPTAFGVEYRTTERFQGKPVYVRLIEFNAVGGNEIYFEPGFYFTSGLVRVTGRFYNSAQTHVYVVPSDEISFQYTPNGYCIKGNTVNLTGYSGSVAFYYVH